MDQLVAEARLFEDGTLPRDDHFDGHDQEDDDAIDLLDDNEEKEESDAAIDLTNNPVRGYALEPFVRIGQYLDHTKALIDEGADFVSSTLSQRSELMFYFRSEKNIKLDCLVEELQPNAVFISTAHQAKGLEWPIVFVPRFNEGDFPCVLPPAWAHRQSSAWSGAEEVDDEDNNDEDDDGVVSLEDDI